MHRILKAQMHDLESMNQFLRDKKHSTGFVQVHAFGRVKVHLDILIPVDGDKTLTKTITVSRNELAKHALYLAKHELNPGVKNQLRAFRTILTSIDREANAKLRLGNRLVSAGRKVATVGHFLYDRNKKLNLKIAELPDEELVRKPKKGKVKRKLKEPPLPQKPKEIPPKIEKAPQEKHVDKPKKEKVKRKVKEPPLPQKPKEIPSKMEKTTEKDSAYKGYRRESDATIDLDESSEAE